MKLFTKSKLLSIAISIIVFVSCNTNEVTKLGLDKTTIALKIGQSDTITASISYSGDINDPVTWTAQNTELISFVEITGGRATVSNDEKSMEKKIAITGLKTGTTLITLKVGDKSIDCQVTVSQTSYNFSKIYASNYGDYYEDGTNNFTIYLLENSLNVNDTGKISGVGTLLLLDFSVAITQNSLSEGNFISSNNGGVNTFFPGEFVEYQNQTYVFGSRIVKIGQTNSTTTLVVEGTYSIKFSDTGFTIEGDLTLGTNESIHFVYNGPVNVVDEREVPVEISPTLTKGRLYYYGVAYKDATTNNFVAYLASQSVNFTDSIWDGDILMLEINTPKTVTNNIPVGTYNVIPKLTEATDLVPSSLVFGYEAESGDKWGTWFFGDSAKKIKTGNMVVSKDGDQYTINYTLFDKVGSKVYGTFVGPLEYIDGTIAPSGVSASRVKSIHQTKSISNIHKPTKRIKNVWINN